MARWMVSGWAASGGTSRSSSPSTICCCRARYSRRSMFARTAILSAWTRAELPQPRRRHLALPGCEQLLQPFGLGRGARQQVLFLALIPRQIVQFLFAVVDHQLEIALAYGLTPLLQS